MPIYEYRCDACGYKHDHLQKINDAPLTTCPECHSDSYVKLISAAGFQLKGSGWYVTDFKNGSQSNPESAAKTEAAKTTASDSSGGHNHSAGGCSTCTAD